MEVFDQGLRRLPWGFKQTNKEKFVVKNIKMTFKAQPLTDTIKYTKFQEPIKADRAIRNKKSRKTEQ